MTHLFLSRRFTPRGIRSPRRLLLLCLPLSAALYGPGLGLSWSPIDNYCHLHYAGAAFVALLAAGRLRKMSGYHHSCAFGLYLAATSSRLSRKRFVLEVYGAPEPA